MLHSHVSAGDFSFDTAPQGSRRVSGIAPLTNNGGSFRLRHFVGDGVGIQESSSSLGVFLPSSPDDEFFFVDGQYSLTNEANSVGNAGLGYRSFNRASNRFWGASLWYDVDGRNFNTFHQLGVTLELVGDIWDLRGNAYLPVGTTQSTVGSPIMNGGLQFQDNSLVFGSLVETETAYDGFDLELGRVWYPELLGRCIRTAVGFYHFQAEDNPHIYGARGRVEGSLTQNLDLGLTLQNDREFDTNLIFGVTWRFGGGTKMGARGCSYTAENRLRQTAPRNQQIVVTRGYSQVPIMAIDPTDGQAFHIIHVDSAASPGGDGTLARPYQTLAEAEAGSVAGDVIYAHADSVFLSQTISLQPNQQFLGEGVQHYINTQQLGSFLLPRATNGTSLPLIQSPADVGVFVNDNTVVSGIRVDGAGEVGIGGMNVAGDVSINRNVITNSAEVGIALQDFMGNVSIADNQVTGSGILGIIAGNPGGGSSVGNVTISRNSVSNTGADIGIGVVGVTGETLISENTVTNSGGVAIGVQNFNGNVTVVDNQATNSGELGIVAGDPGGTSFGNVTMSRNIVDGTTSEPGLGVAGVNGDIVITDNTVMNTGANATFVYRVVGDVTYLRNNVSNTAVEGGFFGEITGSVVATHNEVRTVNDFAFQFFDVSSNVHFANNLIDDTDTEGAIFSNVGGNVDILSNQLSNIGSTGFRVIGVGGDLTMQGNVLNTAGTDGYTIVQVAGDLTITGESISNTGNAGILFTQNTGDALVDGNTISNFRDFGLFFVGNGGTATVRNNTVINSTDFGILLESNTSTFTALVENNTFGTSVSPLTEGLRFFANGPGTLNVIARDNEVNTTNFSLFASNSAGSTFNLFLEDNAANNTYLMDMRAAGTFNLGGFLGTGGSFSDSDNGNLANHGNTTSGGAPTVTALGTIIIVDPTSVPSP